MPAYNSHCLVGAASTQMPPQDVRNAVYLLGCLVDTGRFVFFPALKIILPATINYGNSLAISVTMMSPSWVARKREDTHPIVSGMERRQRRCPDTFCTLWCVESPLFVMTNNNTSSSGWNRVLCRHVRPPLPSLPSQYCTAVSWYEYVRIVSLPWSERHTILL